MSSLQTHHPDWFPPSKILGSAQMGVLAEAAFQVGGDPCIERVEKRGRLTAILLSVDFIQAVTQAFEFVA
jgi:hypothetical protein